MASVFVLAFLSVAVLLLNISCEADLIDEVCSKAATATTCNEALRSDPKYAGLDLRGLGQVAVKKSQSATSRALDVVQSISDETYKAIVETCVETFTSALQMLDDCRSLLKATDRPSISTLQAEGSAALTYVSTCDDEFGDSQPANLREASCRAQEIISALLAIANSL